MRPPETGWACRTGLAKVWRAKAPPAMTVPVVFMKWRRSMFFLFMLDGSSAANHEKKLGGMVAGLPVKVGGPAGRQRLGNLLAGPTASHDSSTIDRKQVPGFRPPPSLRSK